MGAMRTAGQPSRASGDLRSSRWGRLATVVAIVAIAIALNGRVREGADRLAMAAIPRLANGEAFSAEFWQPRAGERALTPRVRDAVALLRDNAVTRYRLSAAVAEHEFVRQRIIEGAWPIRFDPNAEFVVATIGEQTACSEVARRSFDPDAPTPKRQARFLAGVPGVLLARCR